MEYVSLYPNSNKEPKPAKNQHCTAPRITSRQRNKRNYKHRYKYLGFRLILVILLVEVSLCSGFMLGRASATPYTSSSSLPTQEPSYSFSSDENTSSSANTLPKATSTKEDWNLILINRDHPLPEDFNIPELTQLRNGHAIDKRAYPALQEMMDAARAEHLDPLICSSFRTWDRQEELYQNKINFLLDQGYSQKEAEINAAIWVAIPGTSEHQAGLAVDIVDTAYQQLDEAQESTAVQQWLMEHCAEYGFILRYPTDKSEITGIGYEPWHYRYVGKEAAKIIMEQGICLEEYLAATP